MRKFLNSRSVDLTITTLGLTALMTGPAWAIGQLPGPPIALLAGGAIIGTLIIAKLRLRK